MILMVTVVIMALKNNCSDVDFKIKHQNSSFSTFDLLDVSEHRSGLNPCPVLNMSE